MYTSPTLAIGTRLMDRAQGRVVVFLGYTPEHPEYVAYVMDAGRRKGVRPFELEGFRPARSEEKKVTLTEVFDKWQANVDGFAARLVPSDSKPRKRSKAAPIKPAEPVPHPIGRLRKINLDE